MNRRNRVKESSIPANRVIAGVAVAAGVLLVLSFVVPALWPDATSPLPERAPQTASLPAPPVPDGTPPVSPQEERVALPDPVQGELTLDGNAEDGRRLVIPEPVIQQMLAKQSGEPAPAATMPAARVSGAVASLAELKPVIEELKGGPAPAAAAGEPLQDGLALLRSKPADHYTVQLSAGGDQQALQRFARQHGLGGELWIYRSEHAGKPWFVLIQGEHANLAAARTAIRSLPASLASSKPWPKRFAQVQQEMR